MISDAAYATLLAQSRQRSLASGVLGEALYLYQKNYADLRSSDPTLTPSEIERTCLAPTTIDSVMEGANRQFLSNAIITTRKARFKAGMANVIGNIALGVFSNITFVILMLIFYVVARDTAPNVLKSVGVQLASDEKRSSLVEGGSAASPKSVRSTGKSAPPSP